jgi:hypothetical protein
VVQRHIARSIGQQKQDALIPLAAMILAALASRQGGDAAMGVFLGGQGLAIQRQLNFGRDAEREADRIGFQIMGEAGFDTSGMVAFFQQMQARPQLQRPGAGLAADAPADHERIADIQARIREQPYKQRADSLDFFLVRARPRAAGPERQRLQRIEAVLPGADPAGELAAEGGRPVRPGFPEHEAGRPVAAQSWLEKAQDTVNRPPPAGVIGTARRDKAEAIFLPPRSRSSWRSRTTRRCWPRR